MFEQLFLDLFDGRRVAILGYGREGKSTFRRLKQFVPGLKVHICDSNADLREAAEKSGDSSVVKWFLGASYLKGLDDADIIIKSPGIPFSLLNGLDLRGRLTSQSELFLELFRDQVCGITGTKGKSTTASLLHHILNTGGKPSILAGNIGTPCFEMLDHITPNTHIVFEMSSHQLQNIALSPRIAILLNIFQEHLDHYTSFREYQEAKMNIARYQTAHDHFIFNPDNPLVHSLVSGMDIPSHLISIGSPYGDAARIFCEADDMVFLEGKHRTSLRGLCSQSAIPGQHNQQNIRAAVAASLLMDISADVIIKAVNGFQGLPHRMEFVGTYDGVHYYNDSISTIPESTMAALNTFPDTATIILGGTDRGVDYKPLMDFLSGSSVGYLLFTGDAGRRMKSMADSIKGFIEKELIFCASFDEAVRLSVEKTPPGKVCLLSPAAASYDAFKDFEQRGQRFRDLVREFARKS